MLTDAEFRIVITDTLTGAAQAVSDRAYRPSPRLRRLLHVLDRTCGFPGCGAAVWFCDVEHSTPHHHGGPTDTTNCGLVCRRHHRLKTFTHWTWRRDPDSGHVTWTSPDGHHFHRDPVRYLAEHEHSEAAWADQVAQARTERLAHQLTVAPPPMGNLDEPPPF